MIMAYYKLVSAFIVWLLTLLIINGFQSAVFSAWVWSNPFCVIHPSATDISGFSPTNIFAVEENSGVYHFDGTVWTLDFPIEGLHAIFTISTHQAFNFSSEQADNNGDSEQYTYVVGEEGATYVRIDQEWTPISTGVSSFLLAIWGTDDSNLYAVGSGGTIIHYNGVNWNLEESPTTEDLYSIHGWSADDIYVVGCDGSILHSNGSSTWELVDTGLGILPPLSSVYCLDSDNLVIVGLDGTLVQKNAGNWFIHIFDSLTDIWGSSPSNIYVTGIEETLLHFDGSNWDSIHRSSPTSSPFVCLWGCNEDDLFIGGDGIIQYDGLDWHRTQYDLRGVWVDPSSDEVFCVGDYGTILHHDGSGWSYMTSGTESHLLDVWGSSPTDVYAVGSCGIVHYDGLQWNIFQDGFYRIVTGCAADDVYAATDNDIIHYDGHLWSSFPIPISSQGRIEDLESIDSNNLYLAECFRNFPGYHRIHYFDGSVWSIILDEEAPNMTSIADIFVKDCQNLIAVYDISSLASSYNCEIWTTLYTTVDGWARAASGVSSEDFIIVGGREGMYGGIGYCIHFNGERFYFMYTDQPDFYDIDGGFDLDKATIVGRNGTILRWDGYGMIGDVNNDFRIDTSDALSSFRIALELYEPYWEEFVRADANNDGSVTPGDALCIFQEALEIPNHCF